MEYQLIPAAHLFNGACDKQEVTCVSEDAICQKPAPGSMRWTEPAHDGYEADFSYPDEFCLNNQLIGVVDKVTDQRYDWIFEFGRSMSDNTQEEQDLHTTFAADRIRSIDMWHMDWNEMILRGFEFKDADGEVIYASQRPWGREGHLHQHFDLAENERIIGVKGFTGYQYWIWTGYWINPQFLIATI